MTEGRCATCRWWKLDAWGYAVQEDVPLLRPDGRWCSRTVPGGDDDPEPRGPDAAPTYGQTMSVTASGPFHAGDVALWTAPDFGCVQWEIASDA